MKEFLSEQNINFTYVDITSGVTPLRAFLKIRDTSPSHETVREKHTIGVPALAVDDQVYIVQGVEHAAQLIEQLNLKEN